MSTAERTWKPLYLLGELQPGESHFIKGGDQQTIQAYLYFIRRHKGMLRDAKITVKDSPNGAIIRRVS